MNEKVTTEAQIQSQIIKYLNKSGICVKTMASKRGFPDLVYIRNTDGAVFFIEVKRKEGRLSSAQRWVLGTLSDFGANALVARSVDDVAPIAGVESDDTINEQFGSIIDDVEEIDL